MKKSFIISILLTFSFIHNCVAQFDKSAINKFSVYFFLTSEDSVKRDIAFKYIADSTSCIEPHTLMMAGMMLYKTVYKDSSMYWTYLGDIRAKYLSSLYTERSDAALYSSFHAIAIQLTQDYAKNNFQTLYKKINQALDYDRLNPLNPLDFLERSTDTSKYIPKEEWNQHYDKVRQAYYQLGAGNYKKWKCYFRRQERKAKIKTTANIQGCCNAGRRIKPHSAPSIHPTPCCVGYLYHYKPPLANSISPFDAYWKKANIKR